MLGLIFPITGPGATGFGYGLTMNGNYGLGCCGGYWGGLTCGGN